MHGESPWTEAGRREGTLLPDPQLRVFLLGLRRPVAEINIHQIDEICWLNCGRFTAHIGGRIANSMDHSQNLDSYFVEWTFPDGTKAYDVVRYISGCHNEFNTFVHGTGIPHQVSGGAHPGTVHTYKDQHQTAPITSPESIKEQYSPWQAEWNACWGRSNPPGQAARRGQACGPCVSHMMGGSVNWDRSSPGTS